MIAASTAPNEEATLYFFFVKSMILQYHAKMNQRRKNFLISSVRSCNYHSKQIFLLITLVPWMTSMVLTSTNARNTSKLLALIILIASFDPMDEKMISTLENPVIVLLHHYQRIAFIKCTSLFLAPVLEVLLKAPKNIESSRLK